jgi:hypothetical protein
MNARFSAAVFVGLILLVLFSSASGKFPLTKAFIVDPWDGPTALTTVEVSVDIYNRVHLVWVKKANSDGFLHLFYRCYDANGMPLTNKIDMTPAGCGVGNPAISNSRSGQVAIASAIKNIETSEYLHSYWRLDGPGQFQPRVTFGLDQNPISGSPQPGIAIGDSGQAIIALRNCNINDMNCDSAYYVMFDRNNQQLFSTHAASSATFPLTMVTGCKVAIAPSGRFVIAWSSMVFEPWPFFDTQPFARVFNADGTPLADEIPMACEGFPETCSGDPAYFLNGGASGQYPDLAIQDNGDFVVVYRKDYDYDCATEYYFLRRFFADGTPKGPNIRINDQTICGAFDPTVRISSDSAGNLLSVFLVNTGWEEARWDIFAQRFDSEGNRIGENYRINDIPAAYPNGAIKFYAADMNNAGLVAVAWWEWNALAYGWNLALQTMDVADIGYTCGDADDNKAVNISDAVYLISYVFAGGYAPKDICLGDASGDGAVNISDAVALITYIFQGGSIPTHCP